MLAARLLWQPPNPPVPLDGPLTYSLPVADRRFQDLSANLAHRFAGGDMDYLVDFDPTHAAIRLTVTAETIILELAEDAYQYRRTSAPYPPWD